MFSLADVEAVNRRMEALLGFSESLFAGVCIAPEAPDQPSRYRKPSPRFIEEVCARDGLAKERSWMVGDSPSDWEAGWRAGIRIGSVGRTVNEDPAWNSFRQQWGVVSAPTLAELMVPILAASGP